MRLLPPIRLHKVSVMCRMICENVKKFFGQFARLPKNGSDLHNTEFIIKYIIIM